MSVVANHRVHVLCNGRWVAPGTVIWLHPYGRHQPVDIVQCFYALEGADGHITVVDGGLDDLHAHMDERDRSRLGRSRPSLELLAERGIAPEDVGTVILTHLHFDHYANVALFPHARIVINRRELEWMSSPGSRRATPRVGFPRAPLAWLMDEAWERVDVVDGDLVLRPGVRVIETGGHSPGHQIVVVETAEGRAVIAGDEIYLYANLEEDIPIGYYHDFDRVSQAMDLLHELGGIPLPAHDPAVLDRHPEGVIG